MAHKIVVNLIDDLDGSRASETLAFSVDGIAYEIDLNEEHAGELRSILTPYIEVARKLKNSGPKLGGTRRKPSRPDFSDVRRWAKERRLMRSNTGPIPRAIKEQYIAAHAKLPL